MFDASMVTRAMQLEPATQQELEDAASLRPGDYEIYSENVNLMLQEGKEVMTKMGISSMLHSGDTLVAVYTAHGDLVSAVLGTYLITSSITRRSTRFGTTRPEPRAFCSGTSESRRKCRVRRFADM